MEQQLLKASMLIAGALFIAACSKEQAELNKHGQTQGIVFSMSEAPYNDDVDIATRANTMQPIKDTISWDGVEAEVTLERDTEQPKQATRAITSGNHYTIIAFKAGTADKVGETKGYFDATGKFKYDSDEDMLRIPAGNYDFVCYTHQFVTRSGNTISIPLANADKAFICRQTVTINNQKHQEVAFTMKHVGARVRTKLIALMAPTGVIATLGYQANKVPSTTEYDMIAGTFIASTTKNSNATTQVQSYTITGYKADATTNIDLNTVTGNDYLTVLAGTKPEELVYNITSGSIYNTTLNTNGSRKLRASGAFEANGAYTLTIKLIPKILYLFEDGQTGYLTESGRKNHIPIAIVFDAVGKRAIALWNANGGIGTKWDTDNNYKQQRNSMMFTNAADALTNTTSGKVWTWESWDSKHDGTNIVKASDPQFAAYYYAGNFYTSNDLTSHLNSKTLDADLNKNGVWYLPSLYEWKEIFLKLGFGNGSQISIWNAAQCNIRILDYACKIANGTAIALNDMYGGTYYWGSSEYNTDQVAMVNIYSFSMNFNGTDKDGQYSRVRPFVAF